MSEHDPIYINIPCPTKEEGISLCKKMLALDLCGTAKVQPDVHLMWKENEEVKEDEVVIIILKTTNVNLPKIQEFILKNHSWGTPCIEVLTLQTDMC